MHALQAGMSFLATNVSTYNFDYSFLCLPHPLEGHLVQQRTSLRIACRCLLIGYLEVSIAETNGFHVKVGLQAPYQETTRTRRKSFCKTLLHVGMNL